MDKWESTTQNGYQRDEAVSALQKSIRRGLEEEAMFWALELADSGFAQHLWRRLQIIAFEDIGLAAPEVCRLVVAGWLMTKEVTKTWKEAKLEALGTVILAMCRCKKSREGDDFCWFISTRRERGWRLAVPDEAKDWHTRAGRAMGRGVQHWFAEASKLVNAIPDRTYGDKVRELFDERGPVQGGSGQVEETEPGVFTVESFTTPGTFYRVDLNARTCSCPAFRRGPCKHLALIERRVLEGA